MINDDKITHSSAALLCGGGGGGNGEIGSSRFDKL